MIHHDIQCLIYSIASHTPWSPAAYQRDRTLLPTWPQICVASLVGHRKTPMTIVMCMLLTLQVHRDLHRK